MIASIIKDPETSTSRTISIINLAFYSIYTPLCYGLSESYRRFSIVGAGRRVTIFRFEDDALTRKLPGARLEFFDESLLSACLDAIRHFAIQESQPIVIDDQWDVSPLVTDFAKWVRSRARSSLTALSYAREADVFARYLATVRSKELEEAVEDDFWAYKAYRTQGPLSLRVQPTTWNRICAALLRLSRFLRLSFDDLEWKTFRASREDDGARTRIVNLETYIRFRDVGFRGRHQQRNSAFAEFGVTSGMRCKENSALLRRELPSLQAFKGANSIRFELAAPITKRDKWRETILSRRVLRDYLEPYVEEDRAHWVELTIQRDFPKRVYSSRQLDTLGNFLFFDMAGPRKIRIVAGDRYTGVVPIDKLTVAERSRLIEVTGRARKRYEICDIGPLWLSERGGGLSPSSWTGVFSRARERLGDGTHVTPLILRHVFAVHQLQYSLLGLISLRQERGRMDRRGEVYDRVVGDPLRALQRLLGHSDIKSTYKYLRFIEDHQELVERAFEAWDRHLTGARS